MEPQVPRVTLTLPLFNTAREVVFLVSGADKAARGRARVRRAARPDAPAARVRPGAGTLLIVIDEAAAAELIE